MLSNWWDEGAAFEREREAKLFDGAARRDEVEARESEDRKSSP